MRAFPGAEGTVSLQKKIVYVRELFSRSDRGSHARNHWSVPSGDCPQPLGVDPELTTDQGDWDSQESELDAREVAPLYSSADRCFRNVACSYEDHPVTLQLESDITAVELPALHHELDVDPLSWFAAFTKEEYWQPSDAVNNLGGVAAMVDIARQIQIYVDVSSDLGSVSWTVSRLYIGSHRAGDALVPSLRRHVARQINEVRETVPAQRRSRGRVWRYAGGAGGDDAADGCKVHALGTWES